MIRTNPSKNDPNASTKICVIVEMNHIAKKEMMVLEKLWWCNVLQLKMDLEKRTGLNHKELRLISTNYEMRNHDLLVDYIQPKLDKQAAIKKFLEYEDSGDVYIHIPDRYFRLLRDNVVEYEFVEAQLIAQGHITKQLGVVRQLKDHNQVSMERTISLVQSGFNKNINPDKTQFGISGSYFLKDKMRNQVAIFKPMDEEPFAPNNYKGYKGKFGELSLRNGIYSGGLCLREVAAYYLDSKGIHGVPETTLVEIYHPQFKNFCKGHVSMYVKKGTYKNRFIEMIKDYGNEEIKIGSLQKLVRKNGVACDISPSKFDLYEVHKIALLDLRILNCDRNDENILFKRISNEKYELIPIDHGLSLPATLEIYRHDLCWLTWKQVQLPVHEDLKNYILQLNPLDDVMLLKNKLDISENSLKIMALAEIFLKKALQLNLTIYEIAMMVYRDDEDEERSCFEKIVEQTNYIFKRLGKAIPKGWNFYPTIITHQSTFVDKYLRSAKSDNFFHSMKDYEGDSSFGKRKRLYSAQMNLNIFDRTISHDKDIEKTTDVIDNPVKIKRCLSTIDLSETASSADEVDRLCLGLDPLYFYYFECYIDSFFTCIKSKYAKGSKTSNI